MTFQADLTLSVVVFLSGFLGMKLWDMRSGRDHVWEWTFAAERKRAGLPKLSVARPALGRQEERKWQSKAFVTEGAWFVITIAPVWMWSPPHAQPDAADALAGAHVPVSFALGYTHMIILALGRLLWWRKFAKPG